MSDALDIKALEEAMKDWPKLPIRFTASPEECGWWSDGGCRYLRLKEITLAVNSLPALVQRVKELEYAMRDAKVVADNFKDYPSVALEKAMTTLRCGLDGTIPPWGWAKSRPGEEVGT